MSSLAAAYQSVLLGSILPQARLIRDSQYTNVALYNTTHVRRQAFYALPPAHVDMLTAKPFSYLDTLNTIDDAITCNGELALQIAHYGAKSFASSTAHTASHSSETDEKPWHGYATAGDMDKARSTLRQFYRDWSAEGAAERAICHRPIMKTIERERQVRLDTKSSRMRVLVPGAGLGRLVFDLCKAGFDVEGNEISFHQLLASSYILNHCLGAESHTIYPWVHSFSNHVSRENQLRSVKVPDVHCATVLASMENPGQMSMSASDFLCLYGQQVYGATFDVVAALFFLDTAPNILRYLEVIRHCLRSNGLLINFGPLLWHFENDNVGERVVGAPTELSGA